MNFFTFGIVATLLIVVLGVIARSMNKSLAKVIGVVCCVIGVLLILMGFWLLPATAWRVFGITCLIIGAALIVGGFVTMKKFN